MKNIFVGNLDFNASEEGVRSLFERYGQVNSARIMTDRETGRSRGFAFVEMTDQQEAQNAIQQLNGAEMNGRALNVNEARPKPAGGGINPSLNFGIDLWVSVGHTRNGCGAYVCQLRDLVQSGLHGRGFLVIIMP